MADPLDAAIDLVMKCSYLPEADVTRICVRCTEIFREEDNIVKVASPVTIVGDIHGEQPHKRLFVCEQSILTIEYVFVLHRPVL